MNRIINYINENEIPDMVKSIIAKHDIDKVIHQIKAARTEFQKKSQELQWALEDARQ